MILYSFCYWHSYVFLELRIALFICLFYNIFNIYLTSNYLFTYFCWCLKLFKWFIQLFLETDCESSGSDASQQGPGRQGPGWVPGSQTPPRRITDQMPPRRITDHGPMWPGPGRWPSPWPTQGPAQPSVGPGPSPWPGPWPNPWPGPEPGPSPSPGLGPKPGFYTFLYIFISFCCFL